MANSWKKDSIVFIDNVNGYNSGLNVMELKEILQRYGINVADSYTLSVTHFVYCLFTEDMERAVPRPDPCTTMGKVVDSVKQTHAALLKRAIADNKVIISIERILYIVSTLRCKIGYSTLRHSSYRSDDHNVNNIGKPIIIIDRTHHYKIVSLKFSDYCPPLLIRDSPEGISPFIPQESWIRLHEDLLKKLSNIRADTNSRKNSQKPDKSWKEENLKKNVKKKQLKIRSCELCHIQFNNYIQHITTIQHQHNMNNSTYFPYLLDIFNRLLITSWRSLYSQQLNKQLTQPFQDSPSQYLKAIFPLLYDSELSLSNYQSSLSTETQDTSTDTIRSQSTDNTNIQFRGDYLDTSVFSNCYVKGPSYGTWLFPQFYSFLQNSGKYSRSQSTGYDINFPVTQFSACPLTQSPCSAEVTDPHCSIQHIQSLQQIRPATSKKAKKSPTSQIPTILPVASSSMTLCGCGCRERICLTPFSIEQRVISPIRMNNSVIIDQLPLTQTSYYRPSVNREEPIMVGNFPSFGGCGNEMYPTICSESPYRPIQPIYDQNTLQQIQQDIPVRKSSFPSVVPLSYPILSPIPSIQSTAGIYPSPYNMEMVGKEMSERRSVTLSDGLGGVSLASNMAEDTKIVTSDFMDSPQVESLDHVEGVLSMNKKIPDIHSEVRIVDSN